MNPIEKSRVESEAITDFARVMQDVAGGSRPWESMGKMPMPHTAGKKTGRINLDEDKVKNGLGQLVLALVKLLHEVLERQAIRRIDAGSLSDAEIERLGVALMRQAQEIERLRKEFGLEEQDLNLDLGPLGRLF